MDIAERVYDDIMLLNLGLSTVQEAAMGLVPSLCKHPVSADVVADRVKQYASEHDCSDPELAAANAQKLVARAIDEVDYVKFFTNSSNIMNCNNCKENRCKKRTDGYGLPCGLSRCFVCTAIEDELFDYDEDDE